MGVDTCESVCAASEKAGGEGKEREKQERAIFTPRLSSNALRWFSRSEKILSAISSSDLCKVHHWASTTEDWV